MRTKLEAVGNIFKGLSTLYHYLLFLWLGLISLSIYQPKPEVVALVKILGDDNFEMRERGSEELDKLGPGILPYLEKVIANDKDLEVRRRCQVIVDRHLFVESDDEKIPIPGIWHLSNRQRFPLGYLEDRLESKWMSPYDLSKNYYIKARDVYSATFSEPRPMVMSRVWRHDGIEQLATMLLIKDLLIAGMPKSDVKGFLNQMVEQRKKSYYYYQYGELEWFNSIPGPARSNKHTGY